MLPGKTRSCAKSRHQPFGVAFILCILTLTSSAGGLAKTGLAYRFTPGERSTYKLEYKSDVNADLRPLLQDVKKDSQQPSVTSSLVQAFRITLRGEMTATVVERNVRGATVAYNFSNLAISINANGRDAAEQADAMRQYLSREIFAAVDLQGRVLSLRFDPDVDSPSQALARALAGVTQFVLPNGQNPNPRVWETLEDDPAGEYVAQYAAEQGATRGSRLQTTCRTFTKSKLRYLAREKKPRPGEFSVDQTVKPRVNLLACFDASEGRLVSLSGSETQIAMIGEHKVGVADTSVKLDFVRKEALGETELAPLKQANVASAKTAKAIKLSAVPSTEEITTTTRRSTLGDATLESLLADLAGQEASGQRDETSFYLKFRALAYLHPEACAPLGEMLATVDPKSLTFRVLNSALGEVGSSQAQEALSSAIKARSNEWPALMRLIPAIAQAANPTQATEDTLRELALNASDENIASTAQLALGSAARNLMETSPERADRIVDLIQEKVRSSSSAQEIRLGLLTLGNAGVPRALPAIVRFVTDPSTDLRAAAISALRFIESAQATTLLIRALSSEPDAKLRLEAARALSFREMTAATFQAQKKALMKDKDDAVRLAVLNNLWKAHDNFRESLELMRLAASKDASKEVRNSAADIIKTNPKN